MAAAAKGSPGGGKGGGSASACCQGSKVGQVIGIIASGFSGNGHLPTGCGALQLAAHHTAYAGDLCHALCNLGCTLELDIECCAYCLEDWSQTCCLRVFFSQRIAQSSYYCAHLHHCEARITPDALLRRQVGGGPNSSLMCRRCAYLMHLRCAFRSERGDSAPGTPTMRGSSWSDNSSDDGGGGGGGGFRKASPLSSMRPRGGVTSFSDSAYPPMHRCLIRPADAHACCSCVRPANHELTLVRMR